MTTKFNNPMRLPNKIPSNKRIQWHKTDKKRLNEQGKLTKHQINADNVQRYYDLNTRIATLHYDPHKKRINKYYTKNVSQ